jgi:hypothetical protein
VLGCLDEECSANVWKTIFCPHCDAALYRHGETQPSSAEFQAAGQGRGPGPGLSSKLTDLAGLLREVEQAAPEGPAREALRGLGQQLDLLHGQLKDVIQKHLNDADHTMEKLRSDLVSLKDQAAAQKEAKKDKPPTSARISVAKPARKKVDPELGGRLRQQILGSLKGAPGGPRPSGSGEAWENWPR